MQYASTSICFTDIVLLILILFVETSRATGYTNDIVVLIATKNNE